MKNYELKSMWSCEVFFFFFPLCSVYVCSVLNVSGLQSDASASGGVREAKGIENPGKCDENVSTSSFSLISRWRKAAYTGVIAAAQCFLMRMCRTPLLSHDRSFTAIKV